MLNEYILTVRGDWTKCGSELNVESVDERIGITTRTKIMIGLQTNWLLYYRYIVRSSCTSIDKHKRIHTFSKFHSQSLTVCVCVCVLRAEYSMQNAIQLLFGINVQLLLTTNYPDQPSKLLNST